MRKFLFTVIFTTLLFLSFIPLHSISSQTENSTNNSKTAEINYYSAISLRNDLKVSDVALYVNVLSRKLADQIGNGGCEQNTGGGYCLYLLKAEVKEVFKGRIEKENFEFYTTTDSDYRYKDLLLGEHIVFLSWSDNYPDKKMSLGAIENSTRPGNALETMRKIVNPQSPIDENDEDEPYSFKSIENDFKEADAVVYAEVISFKLNASDAVPESFILKAKIIEVFKGKLKAGQEIEYKDNLVYRPVRDEDLGKQVIYLEKKKDDKNEKYERTGYPIGDIRHGILEKLRKIATENSNPKN